MIVETYSADGTRVTHYSDAGYIIRQTETGNLYGSAEDNVPCPYTYEETNEKPDISHQIKRCWLGTNGSIVEVGGQPHDFTLPKTETRPNPTVQDVYSDGWLRITWRHGTPGWRAIGVKQNTESGISDKQAELLQSWGLTEITLFDRYEDIRI